MTVVTTDAHNPAVPGYRPPSTEPRGKWARAIHRKRRADGLSQQAAFELLGSSLGFGPKSRAAYVALDMGMREPTERESEVLAGWLGAYPEDTAPGEVRDTASPGDLYARMDALTGALAELVTELRTARRERDEAIEALTRMGTENRLRLEALERRSGPGGGEDAEHAAPPQTTGLG